MKRYPGIWKGLIPITEYMESDPLWLRSVLLPSNSKFYRLLPVSLFESSAHLHKLPCLTLSSVALSQGLAIQFSVALET